MIGLAAARRTFAALFALTAWLPVFAGPPYATDDPEPAKAGHFEVYAFASGTHTLGSTSGAAGLDINYGLAPDTQLTMVVPIDYTREKHLHGTLGDIELGLKYRLVHQRAGSILPDIAIFPTLLLPTGVPHRPLGEGGLFLPVWLQKDFGAWSWFGGGGYAINIGKARQNTWTLGTAVTRQLGERLNLGAEIYHETAETRSDQAVTGINGGVVYQISEHYGLALSGGPEWSGGQAGAAFYAAVAFEY